MPSIINGNREGGDATPRADSVEDRTLPGLAETNIKSLEVARRARHERTPKARTWFRNGRFVTIEQMNGEDVESTVPDGTS
jgi:hypothetical protein